MLVLNIDTHYVELDIIEENKLKFTRGIHYSAGEPLTGKNLVNELRISIAAYEKESNNKIEKIVITGISNNAKECQELLANELKLPVKVIEQLNNMPVKGDVQNVANKASFVGLLGLCLGSNEVQINLLPEDIVRNNRHKAWQNDFTLTLVLSALILLGTSGVVAKQLYDKQKYLAYINMEIKDFSFHC